MKDEGYVKYKNYWTENDTVNAECWQELNLYRSKLYQKGLIGAYKKSGIGFGNVSLRDAENPKEFLISGTQTGHHAELNGSHYSRVTDYSLKGNKVYCEGSSKASSEALTHAAIYELEERRYQAVFHVHHYQLWKRLLYRIPTTGMHIEYGTPEMAMEVNRLYRETNLAEIKILAMAGHCEGLITFGDTLEEAYNKISWFYEQEIT